MTDFDSWDDLFKWNRSLMEDDWNDGQHLVIKDKRKLLKNHEISTTAKVAEAKDNKHKLALEQKWKGSMEEFGGNDFEAKIKNNGTLTWEMKNNLLGVSTFFSFFGSTVFLQDNVDGLQGAKVHVKGTIDNGAMKDHQAGIKFDNDTAKVSALLSVEKSPSLFFVGTFRCPVSGRTIGVNYGGELAKPTNASTLAFALAGCFKETGMQYGFNWSSKIAAGAFKGGLYNFHFNNKANGNNVGAHVSYDQDAKKWASCLGLSLDNGDHTWKMRFHDSGIMRLALQWQMHRVAKATLNTNVQLRDIPSGSISSLPLNLALELKY